MLQTTTRTRTLLCVTGIALAGSAHAADHREAPMIAQDLSADIADVYAFVNPNNDDNLVLVMTVNGLTVPSENTTFNFSPNVRYTFMVDYDNDAIEDKWLQVSFEQVGLVSNGFRVRGNVAPSFGGVVTRPSLEVEPNEPVIVEGPMGIRAFAGPRDDPFFFDVAGFNRVLGGTGGFSGTDGFAGLNVSAIVLDVPMDLLQNPGDNHLLQVWGTSERRQVTLRRSDTGKLEQHFGAWQQIERMGNPAINTALIPGNLKDLYNIGQPRNDADDFADAIVASLVALGTNFENIGILASVAVPDTLKVNLNEPTAYPNGRGLEDDVIDTLLFFIFNQTPVSDLVDANDKPFLNEFPFLAPPHQPE